MSDATTLPLPTGRTAPSTAGRGTRGATFPRVLAAEWTKLTSLRSTYVIAVATVVVSGFLTYLAANASSVDPVFYPLESLGSGLMLAQVGPLVLGILVGTGEFSTGTARSTFTAVPRRLPVLAAQFVVTGAFALLTAVLAVAADVVGILPAAGSRGISVDLTVDGTPQVLIGTVLFLVGTALLGLALGALFRRPIPAMVTAIFLVLVLPVLLMLTTEVASSTSMTPGSGATTPASAAFVNTLTTFLPMGAGSLLMAPPGRGGIEGAPDLGPWGGGLVLLGWILVPLVVAAVRLRTRDVR